MVSRQDKILIGWKSERCLVVGPQKAIESSWRLLYTEDRDRLGV